MTESLLSSVLQETSGSIEKGDVDNEFFHAVWNLYEQYASDKEGYWVVTPFAEIGKGVIARTKIFFENDDIKSAKRFSLEVVLEKRTLEPVVLEEDSDGVYTTSTDLNTLKNALRVVNRMAEFYSEMGINPHKR